MDKNPLLKAAHIHKTFYDPETVVILEDISLEIYRGESVAIVGRSGEGKSTLLHILGTLEDPCHGELFIADEKVTLYNKSSLRNEKMGFVFQSFHLLEDYTALENVLMPARIARRPTGLHSEARETALQLLDQVGLYSRAHFRTTLLSGGEKQRVALARALCNDPLLIFADEPTGNLDRHHAELINQQLLNFAHHQSKGLLIVTHDEALASLCTKQFELKNKMLYRK